MAYESNGELRHTIQRMDKEVAVLQARLEEKEVALSLQAKEYERRLDDLNHAHALAKDALSTYIPREVYEKFVQDMSEWQKSVDIDRSQLTTKNTAYAAITALIIALMSVAGTFWNVFTHS